MENGKISLIRKKKQYEAGFAVLKAGLSDALKLQNLLHPKEKSYLNTLKFDRRKLSYLLGRISSKQAIASILPAIDATTIFIDSGVFDFPVAKNITTDNIQISISHCENVGIALAYPEEHPLGIDIEKIDPERMDVMKKQMTKEETNLFATSHLSTPATYTMNWTAKEALSKVLKTGITIDLKVLNIKTLKLSDGVYISEFSHFSQYKAMSKIIDGFACSIVLPRKTDVNLRHFWESLENIIFRSVPIS